MNQTLNINVREAQSVRVRGLVAGSSGIDRQVRGAGREKWVSSVIGRGIRFHLPGELESEC